MYFFTLIFGHGINQSDKHTHLRASSIYVYFGPTSGELAKLQLQFLQTLILVNTTYRKHDKKMLTLRIIDPVSQPILNHFREVIYWYVQQRNNVFILIKSTNLSLW